MKRLFLVLGTALVILPWLAGAKAQADAIHWEASGSYTLLAADGNVVPALPNFPFQSAGIQMFPGQFGTGANTVSGTNSGSVEVVQLGGFLSNGQPDGATAYQFGSPSAQYQVNLLLRDQASGTSGTLSFRGYFGGEISDWGFGNLTNTFVGPTTRSLKLGSNLYTVTIGPVNLPPALYGPDFGGDIKASIAVQPAINSAPEPSTMMLACLGLPPLGLARWFRRQRRKAEA